MKDRCMNLHNFKLRIVRIYLLLQSPKVTSQLLLSLLPQQESFAANQQKPMEPAHTKKLALQQQNNTRSTTEIRLFHWWTETRWRRCQQIKTYWNNFWALWACPSVLYTHPKQTTYALASPTGPPKPWCLASRIGLLWLLLLGEFSEIRKHSSSRRLPS